MKKIIFFARVKFEKKKVDYKKAKELMKDEPYKLDLIEDLHKDKEDISFYYSGSFYDLCASPSCSLFL